MQLYIPNTPYARPTFYKNIKNGRTLRRVYATKNRAFEIEKRFSTRVFI